MLLSSILVAIVVQVSHATSTCYVHLGCIETNNSWYSPNRPFNPAPSTREQINATFQLYTVKTRMDGEAVFTDYETFDTKYFMKDAERNYFIIHGFMSWGRADWIMDIKDELLRIHRSAANVFSVDWSGHGLNYAQTAVNARVVGLEVAKFIDGSLVKKLGVPASTVHLVGHSLGAHVAGYVGERVSGVARITGLDPAGLHFAGMPAYVRLDPGDATFVDVIHSDTKGYGTNRPMGHVDFYANGEGEQPGCGALNMFPQFINQGMNATLQESGTCSHSRSHQYFLEALMGFNNTQRCHFLAYRCASFDDLESGKCIADYDSCIGIGCMRVGLEARKIPNERNVIMYFKTSGFRPYCTSAYQIRVDVLHTSVPNLYTMFVLTVYDSKGAATSWTLNNGNPIYVQPRTVLSSLVFSTSVLAAEHLGAVNLHWTSRFYAFGLLRRALINGFIRIAHVTVTTVGGGSVKLCPRNGESGINMYEHEEVMFFSNTCDRSKVNSNGTVNIENKKNNTDSQ